MKICSTGFSGIDLRHVGTVLTQIGGLSHLKSHDYILIKCRRGI